MFGRVCLLSFVFLSLLAAGDKKAPPQGRGDTETIELNASLVERDALKQMLGSDLDGYYVVLEVKVASRFGKEINVERDDFLLRTDKDGEKSTPFAPSQIAGKGAMVVGQVTVRDATGGVIGENTGPVWGGAPGTGDRPRRLGDSGGSVGNTPSTTGAAATMKTGEADPLQKTLEEKALPEKKTTGAVSGLLFFPLGKQKAKDLELIYRGDDGKINIRFK